MHLLLDTDIIFDVFLDEMETLSSEGS